MIEQKLNAEDLKQFRRELILQERSTATVEKYLRDTRQFKTWLGETCGLNFTARLSSARIGNGA